MVCPKNFVLLVVIVTKRLAESTSFCRKHVDVDVLLKIVYCTLSFPFLYLLPLAKTL